MPEQISSNAMADQVHSTESRAVKKITLWTRIRRSWQAYALLAPIFVVMLIFVYYPPVLGLVRAFFDWAPNKEPIFVGFQNFVAYLTYEESGRELTNMAKLLSFNLISGVLAPFIMAELIFSIRSNAAKEVYRLAMVIPILVPGVVFLLLWKHIYDANLGPINGLLNLVGLNALTRDWLGDPATALYAIMGVGFPWISGISTLIVLGGLAQMPDSVFDAALLDGCTGIKRWARVDLPLILSQVRLLVILAVVNGITSIQNILILTRGGPGYATSVPALRMFLRAFTTNEYGVGSAIGVLLFVIAMGITVLINRFLRPYNE
jgi:raffinose/stachyose/melibiose transport system permease protein